MWVMVVAVALVVAERARRRRVVVVVDVAEGCGGDGGSQRMGGCVDGWMGEWVG